MIMLLRLGILDVRKREMPRKILRFLALAAEWMVVMFRDTEGGADLERRGLGGEASGKKENFTSK